MSELTYGSAGAATRDRTHTLFSQTMGYVAVTTGLFALGAYLGRNLSHGWAFVWYIVAFGCLIAMNFTVKRSSATSTVLLLIVGAGARPGARADPGLLREHEPASAVAGRRRYRLVHRGLRRGRLRDPARPVRARPAAASGPCSPSSCSASWLIFVRIPHGELIYSVLGLVIFAGLTMFDFQRLRRSTDLDSAPLLAASIFLDALNVFLFFLRIFSRSN